MPLARDITGVTFKNSSVILMARVVGANGLPLAAAEVSAASYSIVQLNEDDPDSETPVAGHTDQALAVGDIFFATPQTGGLWDVDAVGFNFRHALDVGAQQAFARAGVYCRVRYELAVAGGQAIVLRFKLKVI